MFLSQDSRIHSTGRVSNTVLNPFYSIFWLVFCSASCCFPLCVTYCHSGDLSCSSPAFPEVSHRPKKKSQTKLERMKMETELALTFLSSTFFCVRRGNLYNLVQNVDTFLNECRQGWTNFSKFLLQSSSPY